METEKVQATPEQLLNTIQNAKNIIICIDARIDYDALTSALIMCEYITKSTGATIRLTLDGIIPNVMKEVLSQYSNINVIEEAVQPQDIDFTQYDLQIFLDSGQMNHISKTDTYVPAKDIQTINIDHHEGNNLYGNLNYVKHYASCTSVLYELLKEDKTSDWQTLNVLTMCYLGLVSDSGFFQYSTVTWQDFQIASELLKAGVDTAKVAWQLNFNEQEEWFKAYALTYSNAVIDKDRGIAYALFTQKMLKEAGLTSKDIRTANKLKRLMGIKLAFAIKELEQPENTYKISFRSRTLDTDVLKLAKELNGGGHKAAAGAVITANSMKEALKIVLDLVDRTGLEPVTSTMP